MASWLKLGCHSGHDSLLFDHFEELLSIASARRREFCGQWERSDNPNEPKPTDTVLRMTSSSSIRIPYGRAPWPTSCEALSGTIARYVPEPPGKSDKDFTKRTYYVYIFLLSTLCAMDDLQSRGTNVAHESAVEWKHDGFQPDGLGKIGKWISKISTDVYSDR